jgi:hypothetical protein
VTTYDVSFRVEVTSPISEWTNWNNTEVNKILMTEAYGALFVPDNANITAVAPPFEPGYFIDMSMDDDDREECGLGPRSIEWFDEQPEDNEWDAVSWVRVNVRERDTK